MKTKIIFTCEHAGYEIPKFIKDQNCISRRLRTSHQGWDLGALEVSKLLSKKLKGQLFFNKTTRLLIDANRKIETALHSSQMNSLTQKEIDKLKEQYHLYRNRIFTCVEESLKKNSHVLIFSVHSFTPSFNGKTRKTDIGLLFRRDQKKETALAEALKKELTSNLQNSSLAVHFNRPYRGHTDCLLNDLLDQYKREKRVNGVFLELNQRLLKTAEARDKMALFLASGIRRILL